MLRRMSDEPLTWEALLEEGWERDRAIAARVCDPDRYYDGYLTALWERRRWDRVGGVDRWAEPHPDEAAEEDGQRGEP